MNPGVLMRRDTIIDVLWGEEPPRTAGGLVQAHVSRLRKTLEPWKSLTCSDGAIGSAGGAYAVDLSSRELDLLTFRRLALRAAEARASSDDVGACDLYERAVGLWRGDPLADVDLLQGYPGITLLRQELVGTMLRYADVACALDHYLQVLPRLRALAAAEPLNEPVHARLMIASAGSGEQAAAIQVYEDLRLRLDRELGLYPGDELAEAHMRVLRQDIRPGTPDRVNASRAAELAAPVVPRQLPAAPRHFTGRASELDALSGLLERDSADRSVVIAGLTGMAGIGKTALTVHWAHRITERFPDGQLFVNLRGSGPSGSPLSRTEVACGFLTALGVPAARIPVDDAGRAALFRSLLADRRMLIVLDNAQNAEQVRPLLPGSPGCLVLVTSRNRLTGLAAAEGAHLFTLGVLIEAESRELLASKLGARRAAAEPAAVSELSTLCAHLPLALCDVAARTAAGPRLPLTALVEEMRNERSRLDALETGESATSVRAVFSWSRARVSESAGRMFRLLGIQTGPDISASAAASLAGLSRSQTGLVLAELCDEHLLTEHAPGRYTCHDLLRAYASEGAHTCHSEAELHAAVHRMLDHYLHTSKAASAVLYPEYAQLGCDQPLPGVLPEEIGDRGQAAEWYQSERHVLFAAIGRAAQGGYAPHAWILPWAAGLFFRDTVCWWKLEAAQVCALAMATELGDPAGQALAGCHLGLLGCWLGKPSSASHHVDEAIEVARKHGDRPLHALVGLSRASVLGMQGRVYEALAQAGQSLTLYRAAEDLYGEIHALEFIRWNLERLGKPGQAAYYDHRAHALRRELTGAKP
jgi:DNA-binding SARP family transcriptional activator